MTLEESIKKDKERRLREAAGIKEPAPERTPETGRTISPDMIASIEKFKAENSVKNVYTLEPPKGVSYKDIDWNPKEPLSEEEQRIYNRDHEVSRYNELVEAYQHDQMVQNRDKEFFNTKNPPRSADQQIIDRDKWFNEAAARKTATFDQRISDRDRQFFGDDNLTLSDITSPEEQGIKNTMDSLSQRLEVFGKKRAEAWQEYQSYVIYNEAGAAFDKTGREEALKNRYDMLDEQYRILKEQYEKAEEDYKKLNLSLGQAAYAGVTKQYDFRSNSMARPGIEDDTYNEINGLSSYKSPSSEATKQWANAPRNRNYFNRMTDEERAIYNYIYAKEGPESANDYLRTLSSTLSLREATETYQRYSDMASGTDLAQITATLLSIPQNLIGNIRGVGSLMSYESKDQDLPFDPYPAYMETVKGAATQNTISAQLEEDFPATFMGRNVASQLYTIGLSAIESTALALMLGVYATIPMSVSAAGGAAKEALDKGATTDQALAYGFWSGVSEGVFEYISLDKLIKMKAPTTFSRWLKNVGAQAFVEGSEEVNTTLFNLAVSDMTLGKLGQYEQLVAEYISHGLSDTAARKRASEEIFKGVLWDFIGGAISGGTMAAGQMTKATNQFHDIARTFGPNGGKVFLREYDGKTEMADFYRDFAVAYNKGKNFNGKKDLTPAEVVKQFSFHSSISPSTASAAYVAGLNDARGIAVSEEPAESPSRPLASPVSENQPRTPVTSPAPVQAVPDVHGRAQEDIIRDLHEARNSATTFGEKGGAAFLDAYDGSVPLADFYDDFTKVYAIGYKAEYKETGISLSVLKQILPETPYLTNYGRYEAYVAGMNDAHDAALAAESAPEPETDYGPDTGLEPYPEPVPAPAAASAPGVSAGTVSAGTVSEPTVSSAPASAPAPQSGENPSTEIEGRPNKTQNEPTVTKGESTNATASSNGASTGTSPGNGTGTGKVLEGKPSENVRGNAASGNPSENSGSEGGRAESGRSGPDAGGSGRRSGEGNREGGNTQPQTGTLTDERPTTAESSLSETDTDRGEDFNIDDDLGIPRGDAHRFDANLEAILTVKKIIAEGRYATAEEQVVLSKYVGWGGLPDAFDDRKPAWASRYQKLKDALTEEEYEAASKSTLNAHYTSIEVVKAMYDALRGYGFDGGYMLEPACGSGNFVGAMPSDMSAKVKSWTMVELDKMTGEIAKYLYPNSNVLIKGFQETTMPDNTFDVVISNVPFSEIGVVDKKYPSYVTSSLHNYFIAKSIDKVRPGGIVMVITSRYTMDGSYADVREYFAEKADFLGAVRLPDTAFWLNAGTNVVTDIVVFKKREAGTEYSGEQFEKVKYSSEFRTTINPYFESHPDMVLGTPSLTGTMNYRKELTYTALPGDLGEQIRTALGKINAKIDYPVKPVHEDTNVSTAEIEEKPKPASLVAQDGKIYQQAGGKLVPQDSLTPGDVERITGMIGIRDAARNLLFLQQNGSASSQVSKARESLNKLYDEFVKKHGPINGQKNRSLFKEDPDSFFLCSLEHYDKKTKTATKADIFTKDNVTKNVTIKHTDSIADALAVSINEKGGIDIPLIASLINVPEEDAKTLLLEAKMIFTVGDGVYETAENYLSGNVRAKLAKAESMAEAFSEWKPNAEALRKVIPADIPFEGITVTPGARWIPTKIYSEFVANMLNRSNGDYRSYATVTYSDSASMYEITVDKSLVGSPENRTKWGTPDRSFLKLFDAILNGRSIRVGHVDAEKHYHVDEKATIAANEKADQIKEEFQRWAGEKKERMEELTRIYNDSFNCLVNVNYDGSHLTVDGITAKKSLRDHQKNVVQRIISSGGNVLIAHEVGAGKTAEMASAAMKLRQLGIIKKPLFVVPKSILSQWGGDFLDFYPGAHILVANEDDLSKGNRITFENKIITGDYDAVIVSYEQFKAMPLSAETQISFLREEKAELEESIRAAVNAGRKKDLSVKQMEKAKLRLELKIKELEAMPKDENGVDFEALGIDGLFVDEAHNYKNLFYTSNMTNVSGLGTRDGSQRAFDLYEKVRYLQKTNGGRGIVFATATPVMNTMAETYIMQKYLQYDKLKQLGLLSFDAWAAQFGQIRNVLEIKPSGKGYRVKQSFSHFVNVPELVQFFRSCADILTEIPGIELPTVHRHTVVAQPSQYVKDYIDALDKRADEVAAGHIDKRLDNMLKITSDGRKASYTQRMIDPSLPYEEGCKIELCVQNALDVWKKTTAQKSTQLIFCDLAVPKGKDSKQKNLGEDEAAESTEEAEENISIYKDIRAMLVARGVPENEIAFIHDANTNARKQALYDDMNAGRVRILIGSTGKMSVGMNVQKRLIALHHLDAPWRPGDIKQREGRIIRQLNGNKDVDIFTYVTEGTFDARMWDNLQRKAAFINAIMNGSVDVRDMEDVGEMSLSCAEIKAVASGNPLIKEQVEVAVALRKLLALKSEHFRSISFAKAEFEKTETLYLSEKNYLSRLEQDAERVVELPKDSFSVVIKEKEYTNIDDAGKALKAVLDEIAKNGTVLFEKIGEYCGFDLEANSKYTINTAGAAIRASSILTDAKTTFNNLKVTKKMIDYRIDTSRDNVKRAEDKLKTYEEVINKPFEKQGELDRTKKRNEEIAAILNPNKDAGDVTAAEEGEFDEDEDGFDDDDGDERYIMVDYGNQEVSSADTSVNKEGSLPKVFSKVEWKPGTVNLDYGGGKYDNATEYLDERGVRNLIFDKYNRTPEHNAYVISKTQNGQADTVTISNLLNVIKEPEARAEVLANAADAVKPDGEVYITVYVGNKSGVGAYSQFETKIDENGKKVRVPKSWQEHRVLSSYIPEAERFFEHVVLVHGEGGMLVCTGPKKNKSRSSEITSSDTTNPLTTLAGSRIKRSSLGVGKQMGKQIYVHKDYVLDVVPEKIYKKALSLLPSGFSFNTIMYDSGHPSIVRFDESTDFNTAREPSPGRMIYVDTATGEIRHGSTKQIFHHKWLWVKDGYSGFDVQEAYDWSKTWLKKITNPSGYIEKWNEALEAAGLPVDTPDSAPDVMTYKKPPLVHTPDEREMWEGGARNKDAVTDKPMGLTELIARLHKEYGIPLISGGVRGKGVLGQYNNREHSIRTKAANDAAVASHELGHHIDNIFRITENMPNDVKKEIVDNYPLANRVSYAKKLWPKEGFAEFIRHYFQNKDAARSAFPKACAYLEKVLPKKDLNRLNKFADEFNAAYVLDQETATSSIRLMEEGPADYRSTGDKVLDAANDFYQKNVDRIHSIRRFDEAVGSNVYTYASNSAYSDVRARNALYGDLRDIHGNKVCSGLKTVLKGVNTQNKVEYKDFGEYLVVRHGPERLSEGMQVFGSKLKDTVEWMVNRQQELEAQYPEFRAAADRLYDYQQNFLQTWAVETGLISQETADKWQDRWQYYVPLNRALYLEAHNPKVKRGYANQKAPFKKAVGSGLDIIHPVDNIINNVIMVINASTRNDVMIKLTKAAKDNPDAANFILKEPTPISATKFFTPELKARLKKQVEEAGLSTLDEETVFGVIEGIDDILLQYGRGKAFGNIVTVLKNGKPEFWRVTDPELLDSITNMSPSRLPMVFEMIGRITRFMTSNITGRDPIWSTFSNAGRDLLMSLYYSKDKNILHLLTGIASAYKNKIAGDNADELYQEYLSMGGGGTSSLTADKNLARSIRNKITGNKSKYFNPLEWIEAYSDMIESGPRYACYRTCRTQYGMTPEEAFYAAMDLTVNFRRSGVYGSAANVIVPFYNASVQGVDKFFRYQTASDAPTAIRGKVARTRALWFVGSSMILALLSAAINGGDDEKRKNYALLSNFTKNTYWCFPVKGGKYFCLPKPRECGVLTSYFESLIELYVFGNKEAFEGFYDYASGTFLPNVVSSLAQGDFAGAIGDLGIIGTISNMVANRDFLGKPIVPSGLERLNAEDQFTRRTSVLAKIFGQTFNFSPLLADYFASQVLGGFWKWQKALFPVGRENVDYTLGIRNTYVKDNLYSTDAVNRMYDTLDSTERNKNSHPTDMHLAVDYKNAALMATFYSNYYNIANGEPETEESRDLRRYVLDMIVEFNKSAKSGVSTDLEKAVENVCVHVGNVELMPAVLDPFIKMDDGTEIQLTASQYVDYQTNYLTLYWKYAGTTLGSAMGKNEENGAALLYSARTQAAIEAKGMMLDALGYHKGYDAYEKIQELNEDGISTAQYALFEAALDIANDDGPMLQEEFKSVIRAMDNLTNPERSALFHTRYESDKNNDWA